ncbi:MAG: response regulator [Leptospiraceae bacterium]|nr:response regulator [Leptospiraceae bacterium]MBK7057914.1 response regulator [Leptospiraceae bacterium]MBL0263760.1 response regulator [Leptospiraceae bacterium]HRG44586.1 response regulator [Leptospiraceae bacterium]HRG73153.1 response regulator [Leptospiraceae bacterium]
MNENVKIPRYPVLIVEDKKENQVLLQSICNQLGISTETASNGQIALDLINTRKFSIFIVDLMLPVMDGKTFIEKLKVIDPHAVVIIQSALDASDTIIEVMRLGVFDYAVKPIDIDLFRHTMSKALEYKYLKDLEAELTLNESIKLRGQLEWLNYKETLRVTGKDSYQKNSIFNLTTSLSQGGGVGVTISLLDMLKMDMVENGDTYIVNKEVLDTLYENNEYSRRVLQGLATVVELMEQSFNFADCAASVVIKDFPQYLKEIVPFMNNKDISIAFPSIHSNCKIEIDLEKMRLVFEELLINAYKYSVRSSRIDIFAHVTGTYFCITFKNEIDEFSYGGIPPEKEKLVLEPFFRIHPPVEDILAVEKFSLGLGLTVVDFIINKHNGMFFIHNAVDHTGKRRTNCVLAEIFLPIKLERS